MPVALIGTEQSLTRTDKSFRLVNEGKRCNRPLHTPVSLIDPWVCFLHRPTSKKMAAAAKRDTSV